MSIPIINLFEYPTLKQVTLSSGKRYYTYNDSKMASVTTILNATSDKTALLEWRKRVGEKKAQQETKEASGLGSLLHTHLENHIKGEERPGGSNVIRKMASDMADIIIANGLSKVTEVWGIEKSVYFPDLYAGTIDLVGCHDNEPAIMDYKTSKKIKKEEWIENYYLQGCAYALAHNQLFDTNIRKVVLFMVSRDNEFKEFVLEGEKFDQFCDEWCRRVEQYYKLE